MLALIDTDPGIDDALALLYAWGSPGLRLAGITTVAGNVDVEEATRNLFRLIALRRPSLPPVVARGAAAPLARPLVTARGYHGEDGLGGVNFNRNFPYNYKFFAPGAGIDEDDRKIGGRG